jgi:hypothetical protein
MTAKRLMIVMALAVLAASTGCRSWCEQHYPCQQPVYAAPQGSCCAPCAPGTSGYVPPAPATPVSRQDWGAPRTGCTCTCP